MSFQFKTFVFLLAVLCSSFFHFENNRYLKSTNPELLREGVTVLTRDDASYLAPAENFLEKGEWKSNAVGRAAYTTRSPGYGMIYLPLRLVFNQKGALLALVIFQILLFAYSITLIPDILGALYLNRIWKKGVTLTFAVLPMFNGFLSYTLTEGITPALVIILLALACSKNRTFKNNFLLWIVLSVLILIRPPMIVWLFLLPVLYFPFRKKLLIKLFVGIVVSLAPTVIWQFHLYRVTGKYQGLHPIYQDDSNTVYRHPHQAIWNFHKSWGQEGADFHKEMDFLSSSARYNRNKDKAVSQIVENIPQRVKTRVKIDSLNYYYSLYYDIISSQKAAFNDEHTIQGLSYDERRVINFFRETTRTYIISDLYFSSVVVPARIFKKLTLHSNLSLFIFQQSWRGNFAMEVLRILCFAIHSLAFYLFLLSIFILFPNKRALMMIVPIALYVCYLCFVQRGIEERYTLPVLIPVIALSSKSLELIYRRSIYLIKGK